MPATCSAINLSTPKSAYEIDPENGGLCLISGNGVEYQCKSGTGNWRLVLMEEDGGERVIGPADCPGFRYSVSGDFVTCSWETDGGLEVKVVWQACEDLLLGRISYKSTMPCRVKAIQFPVVEFAVDGSADLVIPSGIGKICHNALRRETVDEDDRNCGWRYLRGGGMQFSACMSSQSGLYFDMRDPYGYIKGAHYRQGGDGTVVYTGEHLMPLDDNSLFSYEMPYPSACAAFAGGWFAAAEIYRSWAQKQKWAVKALQKQRKEIADRIGEIALWVWNRGSSEYAAAPVEQVAAELGLPVAMDWYWWHRNPYDTEYPRYLPPREGAEKFKSTVARLKSRGIFTQVYINGMLWDAEDVSWKKGGRQSVIVKEDGRIMATVFNPFIKKPLAYMCGSGSMFHDTVRKLAASIRKLGLDGLYLDVISNASGHPCYNSEHTHPLGGGTYQVEGYRSLLESLQRRCPGMALSSEGSAEVYMDLLDTAIMIDPSRERFSRLHEDDEVIPLFPAVYHNCFPLFGNYALADGNPPYDSLWPPDGKWKREHAWNRICPDQFFLEIAKTLAWGLVPSVANLRREHLESPDFKAEKEFLLNSARTYHANREFLRDGTMLPPGELKVRQQNIKLLTRMIFTKEGRQVVYKRTMPSVIHSAWQASDGRRLLLLVNYTRRASRFSYSNMGQKISGTIGQRSFMLISF